MRCNLIGKLGDTEQEGAIERHVEDAVRPRDAEPRLENQIDDRIVASPSRAMAPYLNDDGANHLEFEYSAFLQSPFEKRLLNAEATREINEETLFEVFNYFHRQSLSDCLGVLLSWRAAGTVALILKARVGHSHFGDWLESHFCTAVGVSSRTVRRYMTVAKYFPQLLETLRREGFIEELPNVANLVSGFRMSKYLSPSRAYLLLVHELQCRRDDGKQSAKNRSSRRSGAIVTKRHRRSTSSNEWLSPQCVIDAVLKLWPKIDVDPCGEVSDKPNIPAAIRHTRAEDGLGSNRTWKGRVFANPGSTYLQSWLDRARYEFEDGQSDEIILLLPVCSDVKWASSIGNFPRAFIRPRQSAYVISGKKRHKCKLPNALMVVPLLPLARWDDFAVAFAPIADVYYPFDLHKFMLNGANNVIAKD